MIPYTLHLDLSGGKDPNGKFLVEAISVDPFIEQQIDNMVITRKSWGNVRFRNMPYKNSMLYDIIQGQKAQQQIHITFTSQYETLIGYFGIVDCKVDDDNKVISVDVTELDQYTPFIEGRETEVKLFDISNVVRNSYFAESDGEKIKNWDVNLIGDGNVIFERVYLGNENACSFSDKQLIINLGGWDASANIPYLVNGYGEYGWTYYCVIAGVFNSIDYNINDSITYNGSQWVKNWTPPEQQFPTDSMAFSQTCGRIIRNKQLTFSFNYFLAGTSTRLKNLSFDILIYDEDSSDIYRLLNDGSWTRTLQGTTHYYYKNSKSTIPYENFDKYLQFIDVTRPTPVNGNIQIIFYRPEDNEGWDLAYKLYITNVQLSAAEIQLQTIKIKLSANDLVTAPQSSDKIYWKDKKITDGYFFKRSRNWKVRSEQSNENKYHICSDFFYPDGRPKMSEFESDENGMKSNEGRKGGLNYGDLIRIFEQKLHPSHKFELSSITVYQGVYSESNHRYWYATAEFSREERYTIDLFVNNEYIPLVPEEGVNWVDSGIVDDNHKRLWIRTPFNNSIITWNLGDIKTYAKPVRHELYNFDYYTSLTSVKNYPISAGNSITVETAISLREVIRKVYVGANEELIGKNVYSTFFWNDTQPAGINSVLFVNGNIYANYVSGESVNPLNNIAVIHTNDLSDSSTFDEEKTVLKISGKKLIDDLRVLFPQLYWFIDADKNLHIEHVKFFDKVNNVRSLIGGEYDYIKNFKAWEYDKNNMFSLEEYEIKNSGYTDFKTSKITFDKIVSNKRGEDIKGSYTTQNLTTDIQYCVENANSIDNGMILVCYENKLGDYVVKYGEGQKSGRVVINGDISISTLLNKYARYEGTFVEGNINDKPVSFEYTKRVRKGKEISIKGIFNDKIILNDIGRGVLTNATFDYLNENTKCTFNYRYGSIAISNGGNNIIDTGSGDPITRTLPTVTTNASYNIIYTLGSWSIYTGGSVTNEGGLSVTERGVCYGIMQLPTISDNKSVSGSGFGAFTNGISGFSYGTYYLRAFATNSMGTSYGDVISFIIAAPTVATVLTNTPSNITSTSFNTGGNVTFDGYSDVTEKGVVYGLTPNPTTAGSKLQIGSGTGSFSGTISGLTPNKWYFRAYAINAIGTSYGFEMYIIIT